MKTLVVHSGTYKTGSSAIQLYLARAHHARDLGTASYPRLGRGTNSVQHGNLNAELRGGRAFVPRLGAWDDVITELVTGEADTAIVSTENFSTLTGEQAALVGAKCAAAGVRVRWVHYLREQAGFYNAFYVERLVNMRPEFSDIIDLPFEEFGTWSPIDMGFLDYAGFVEMLRAAIPDVDVVLRPFTRGELVGGDVVADFCAAVGIPYVERHAESTNVGTGWRTTETARRLTPLIRTAGLPLRVQHKANPAAARLRWLQLIRSELSTRTTELGWNDASAIYLTPQFRAELHERYRAGNERVAELTGLEWQRIVDAEPVKDYNIGDYATIDAEQLMSVVHGVLTLAMVKPDEIHALPQAEPPEPPSLLRRAARRVRRG